MERESGGRVSEPVYRLKELRKLAWAIAAGFAVSGLLILFTIGVITGSITSGLAIAIVTLGLIILTAAIFMDVLWEGWGVQLFSVITLVIVMLLILNIIFGRQVMP